MHVCLNVCDSVMSLHSNLFVDRCFVVPARTARYPFFHFPHVPLEPPVDASDANRIHAVIIMYDPVHWGVDVQIACDVIRGGFPLGSGKGQAVPVYACNPDFVFAGAYPVPVSDLFVICA